MSFIRDNLPSGKGGQGVLGKCSERWSGNYPYNQHTRHATINCEGFTKLKIDEIKIQDGSASASYDAVIQGYDASNNSIFAYNTVGTASDLEFDITGCVVISIYSHQAYDKYGNMTIKNLRLS